MSEIDYYSLPEIYKYRSDGSHPKVPERFLRGLKYDKKVGEKRWKKTLKWRKKMKIDELVKDQSGNYVTRSKILSTPHTFFKTIKKHYPSYIHNKAKNGSPVVIEKFGEINIKKLHEANITSELIIWHYLYCYEWQWNHLTPSESLKNLSIYDVKGLTLKGIFLDNALGVVKKLTKYFAAHYIERAYKVFIINVSSKFLTIWNMIQPFIPVENRGKIVLLGEQDSYPELLEEIDADKLPIEYGGSDYTPLGMSDDEIKLSRFVKGNEK